jgi:hypothetical protein
MKPSHHIIERTANLSNFIVPGNLDPAGKIPRNHKFLNNPMQIYQRSGYEFAKQYRKQKYSKNPHGQSPQRHPVT